MSKINTYQDRKKKWSELRGQLKCAESNNVWVQVFKEIFLERFLDRYFNPAKILLFQDKENNYKESFRGSGFAVISILTTSIETLSTLFEGKFINGYGSFDKLGITKFNKNTKGKEFVNNFLKKAKGFKKESNNLIKQNNFHKNFRNSLFHFGGTNNEMKIKTIGSFKINNEILEIDIFNKEPELNKNYKILNENVLNREIFYFHLRFTVMRQIYCEIKNGSTHDNINLRYSMARLLDVIYSEGEYTNIDYYTNWWNDDSIKENKKLSNCQKLKKGINDALKGIKC